MHVCLVCGYDGLEEPPRGASGGGSYELCPCCGYQYGVDDDDRGISPEQARESWMQRGMPWHSKSRKAPVGWDAQSQLARLIGTEIGGSKKKASVKKKADGKVETKAMPKAAKAVKEDSRKAKTAKQTSKKSKK